MPEPELFSEEVLANLHPLSDIIAQKILRRMGRPENGLGKDELMKSVPNAGEILALDEAAAELKHSYHWLSRSYRKLGLKPSRVGGKLLFTRKEITALLIRQQVSYRGRPRAALSSMMRPKIKGTIPVPSSLDIVR